MPPTLGPRPFSRRDALIAFGAATAAALLAACTKAGTTASGASSVPSSAVPSSATAVTAQAASCVLTKEQEQGPYYYPAAHVRSDITDGKAGVPMQLALTIVDATTCQPIPNAGVDVWQADALGEYSDTSSGLYLRGIQLTGADGVARFTSIYPGWYPSRTNHVHVKVHVAGDASTTYTGGHVSHTGNLFFPEEISTAVAKVAPYTDNKVERVTLTRDFVYTGQNGSGSVMKLTPLDAASPEKGYEASIVLGIDPSSTAPSIGISGTVS